MGVCIENLKVLAKCLNCRLMNIPFKYLEMLIGGNPRREEFWNPIIDKIKLRLSRWKGKVLSLAREVCLIKSVINH